MAGLAVEVMNGQRVAGLMLMAVGAGRGVDQEVMGRQYRLEPLLRIVTVCALLGGIMAVMQGILGPVTGLGVADLTDAPARGLFIGKTALGIKGVGVKEGYLPGPGRRGRDDLPDQLTVNETKGFAGLGRIHRALYGYGAIVGRDDLVGGVVRLIQVNDQDQAPV